MAIDREVSDSKGGDAPKRKEDIPFTETPEPGVWTRSPWYGPADETADIYPNPE